MSKLVDFPTPRITPDTRFALTAAGERELDQHTEFRAGMQVRIMGWNLTVTLCARKTLRGAHWWVTKWDAGGTLNVPEALITEIAS